jgi:hypothetical protein
MATRLPAIFMTFCQSIHQVSQNIRQKKRQKVPNTKHQRSQRKNITNFKNSLK